MMNLTNYKESPLYIGKTTIPGIGYVVEWYGLNYNETPHINQMILFKEDEK